MHYWDYRDPPLNKLGSMAQIAGARRYEFADGKAKGVEAVEIRTGSGLQFTVLPGRGMDIAWSEYRGVPLNYFSKTGVVSPAYYENHGMNWLHSFFAGTLTTCGLLHVGNPETVPNDAIGPRDFGLHGRISNCAAEQVSVYEDWEDGDYVMRVSGLMREAVLKGESLTLRREITAKLGESSFTIRDVVTNHDARPQDIMLLYHFNMGYPLLDADSRLIAASAVTPADEGARTAKDSPYACGEPDNANPDRGYYHRFTPAADGLAHLAFVNDRLALGVALTFSPEELPFFNQWKCFREKDYVMGLEPCTSAPIGIGAVRRDGTVMTLAPGERREFHLTYTVLDGGDAIGTFEKNYLKELSK